jgi:excisionase family DNA binding protein
MAQAKYEIRRKCPICGAVFQIRTIDSVYCSKQCSDVVYKRKKDREAKEAKYEQLAKEIPEIREFLSVQEAVAVYCVERDTLYREIRKGKIPSVNLGTKQLRLNRADLEQRYPRRKKVRKAAQKPIPKTYNMEPENCYTIGEISKKYRIHDSSVWHISVNSLSLLGRLKTMSMLPNQKLTNYTNPSNHEDDNDAFNFQVE